MSITIAYDWCQVVPFPLCELQSKWIAGLLSDRLILPSEEEMMEDVNAFYSDLEASGQPKRYNHNLGHPKVKFTFKFCLLAGFSLFQKGVFTIRI